MNMAAKSLEDLNVLPVALAMTEPVYTKALFGPKLLSLEKVPLQLNLPACSVAVERGVMDVTQAAAICSDSRERDGLIFQHVISRKKTSYAKRNRVMSA